MSAHTRRRHRSFARPLVTLLSVIATVGALSGCVFTGGDKKVVGEAVEVLLPRVSRGLHWVGDVAPSGGALSEVARGLGSALDTGTSIKAQFEKIAASDDPYGEALVTATCYGLTNIASQYQQNNNVLPASAQSWEDFLNSEVARLLPGRVASELSARVTQFNNAAALASINPRSASIYVQECAIGRG
jgi:hypothetical protein